MLIESRPVLLGIYAHATELIDIEWSAESPYSFLFEDGWSAVFAFNGNITYKE
jgi:hypothetical protein